jgi:hypothetical protein
MQTAVNAATLTSDTMAAWEAYLEAAHSRMQERLEPGHRFLSIDETEERAEKIRGGEPFIFPFGRTPQKVPSGLIHDWVGIAFIPNAKISDVLSTVRDYEHYSEFYRPAVADSKVSKDNGPKDHFSMVLYIVDESLFCERVRRSTKWLFRASGGYMKQFLSLASLFLAIALHCSAGPCGPPLWRVTLLWDRAAA